MSYKYRSLGPQEIRVLTLEPGGPDPASPVRCSLDNVPLPRNSSQPTEQRCKGDSYVWPETQSLHDVAPIFKKGSEPQGYNCSSSTRPHAIAELTDDANLPWMHAWGDYITLSYAWGAPDPTRAIFVNGREFPVAPNLYAALLQLRQTQRIRQGFRLWIDAICINQADMQERSQQVACMRDIYASAWQVAIWLGPEADDSDLAFTAMGWISSVARDNPSLDTFYRETWKINASPLAVKWPNYKSPLRKTVNKALFYLFTRPYWHRMWILQEVAMARSDAPVLCGGRSMTWSDIYDAATFISRDEGRLGRDIVASVRPRAIRSAPFEFGMSRLLSERQWATERMWGLLVEITQVQRNQRGPEGRKLAANTLRPLLVARDAAVSEEKDRVYGVLGFREVADMVTIEPNYELPLPSIYIDFTRRILATGDLNILRLASEPSGHILASQGVPELPPMLNHPRITPIAGLISSLASPRKSVPVGTECTHELPSWAICWTCKPAPTAQLRGLYDAGGPMSPANVLHSVDLCFTVTGYLFDTVGSLSSFHVDEVDTHYPVNTLHSAISVYGDLESTKAAFWRTIVADTTAKGETHAPETYSWLLDSRVWGGGVAGVDNNGFDLSDLMARNRELMLCGYSLEELVFPRKKGSLFPEKERYRSFYNPTKEQAEALSWAVNATAWRRILGTENGRMGLGPAAAMAGDAVAVFPGCDTPIILRGISDGWKVVGECYVHGAMYGEIPRSYETPSHIKLY